MARASERFQAFPSLVRNSDLAMAVGVIGILIVMVIPVPPVLMDLLLSFNITLSIIVLLVSMYILQPIEFSVFPSLLLMATLFRLSLNVATTRLILLHGHEGTEAAGQVIKAFGTFVVGGNYVVGMVIFMILVIINFVVITKGATRIAEVAARFTLDAMPGKQMSIDADLNAGLISDAEARERRLRIAREADFYGAMDGASKFVRGDAIAGIIIALVNIIGGLVIGFAQQGMSLSAAAQNYTLLTIGDGLVSQIPALVISTAAGIVVTRAASDSHLSQDMVAQITMHPRAIGIASAVLLFFALVPGLPHLPFLALAALTGVVSYKTYQAKKASLLQEQQEEAEASKARTRERVESLLPLDILALEVGYGLIPLVDAEQGGELLERIKSVRRQFALDMGIIVPPMHVRDNLQLDPDEYVILIKGNEVVKGKLMAGRLLAMNPGSVDEEVEGVPTHEPAFGIPALWVTEKLRDRAQGVGYTVVDHSTVVATHISEVIKAHADELLGRQEVQLLLDHFSERYPKVVEELIPNLLSLGATQKVLQNLLRERVSIRDLLTILETLADYAPVTKSTDILTEYVRQRLARLITKSYRTPEGDLFLLTLHNDIEETISGAIQHTEQESYLSLEPSIAQKILAQLKKGVEGFREPNTHPVVLCSPPIRSQLRKLTERFIPNLTVLSHNEITNDVKIKPVGMVSLTNAH